MIDGLVLSLGAHPMIAALATTILVLTAAYLIGLAAVAVVAPARFDAFLLGFAQSPSLHWLEMAIRILVGLALWMQSPAMPFPSAFSWGGIVLLATSLLLLALPYRWHRQFAERSVPRALRYRHALAAASATVGISLLACLWRGGDS